jgi:hypothetical protein
MAGEERRRSALHRAAAGTWTGMEEPWDIELGSLGHRLTATFERGIADALASPTRTLVLSQLAALVVPAGLAFGSDDLNERSAASVDRRCEAMGRLSKARTLAASPARLERVSGLLEIRANRLLVRQPLGDHERRPWEEFTRDVAGTGPSLAAELTDEDAYRELEPILADARERIGTEASLPFPLTYNADITLSRLAHALVRTLRPALVVETGVGFGGLSTSVLHALESVGTGRLVSVDLPPLGDPGGDWIGAMVPEELRHRWTLHRGSTRRLLPGLLATSGAVGLFLSDSANVYTLQRWEYQTVKQHLASSAAAVFNNVDTRFWRWVTDEAERDGSASSYAIRQRKDPAATTGLLLWPAAR